MKNQSSDQKQAVNGSSSADDDPIPGLTKADLKPKSPTKEESSQQDGAGTNAPPKKDDDPFLQGEDVHEEWAPPLPAPLPVLIAEPRRRTMPQPGAFRYGSNAEGGTRDIEAQPSDQPSRGDERSGLVEARPVQVGPTAQAEPIKTTNKEQRYWRLVSLILTVVLFVGVTVVAYVVLSSRSTSDGESAVFVKRKRVLS